MTKFKVGDEVKIIANTNASTNKVGDIGIIKNVTDDHTDVRVPNGPTSVTWSKFNEIELVTSKSTLSKEEELLAYARKHYPIGTRYIPAHVEKGLNEVIKDDYRTSMGGIYVTSKRINGDWNESLHYNGRWAEIVSKPEEVKEEIPSILKGRYIEALVDYPVGGSVKKGEIGIYISEGHADFPGNTGYACSDLRTYIKQGKFKLLPKDYSPKKEVKEFKPQFIVGRWYTSNQWSSGSYCKFLEIKDGRFYFSEKISLKLSDKYSNTKDWWSLFGSITECSLEEIQQYLPDGHVDKIVKESPKTNPFKPGDLVVLVPENYDKSIYSSAKTYCSKLPIDTVLKVDRIVSNGSDTKWKDQFVTIVEDKLGYNLPFDCFRFATPSEISSVLASLPKKEQSSPKEVITSKFNIGDEVGTGSDTGVVVGFTLVKTILVKGVKQGHDGNQVDVIDKYGNKLIPSGNDYWFFTEKDLTLIPKSSFQEAYNTSTGPTWIPKVGDWAYYIGDAVFNDKRRYTRKIKEIYNNDNDLRFEDGISNDKKFYRKAEPHEIPADHVWKDEPIPTPSIPFPYTDPHYVTGKEGIKKWQHEFERAFLYDTIKSNEVSDIFPMQKPILTTKTKTKKRNLL